MIHEYALEPGLLNSWERFRYLTEKFGICEGRLISRYPKRWKAMVYEALNGCSEIERKRIEVKLQFIDDRMIGRVHEWNSQHDWLANAEAENGKRPFHAIVASGNPRGDNMVLVADDLEDQAPLWKVERERVIERQADALANAVATLVSLSRRLVFVDPNFSPYKPKARNTMKAFLAKVVARNNGIPIDRIEFHAEYKPEIQDFAGECNRQLPQRIPAGLQVTVIRWQERPGGEGLHNRYILTDRGGIRLAWGLDEGTPSQTDDISLLEPGLFAQRWGQYCGDHPAFDLFDSIELEGNA